MKVFLLWSAARWQVHHGRVVAGRVVVGVHGSESSRDALLRAIAVAEEQEWDLDVVTAWPDADEPFIHDVPGRYVVARGLAVQRHRDAMREIEAALAQRVRTFVLNARPAQALLAVADGADLIVVGAGRPGGVLQRLGVGAECSAAGSCRVLVVSATTVTEATSPVLEHRGPGGRRSRRERPRARSGQGGAVLA